MQVFRARSGRSTCLRDQPCRLFEGNLLRERRLPAARPERERPPHTLRCLDRNPTHHFAHFGIPNLSGQKSTQILPLGSARKLEDKTRTASSWPKREHETGRVGGGPEPLNPQRERTVPAVSDRLFAGGHLEARVPHQGSVREHPYIPVTSLFLNPADEVVELLGRDRIPIGFRSLVFDKSDGRGDEVGGKFHGGRCGRMGGRCLWHRVNRFNEFTAGGQSFRRFME